VVIISMLGYIWTQFMYISEALTKKSKSLKSGFTIVELLIVIVVIAILAAISIVAYNGIQTRAENTKTINAVGQYAKAVSIYQTTSTTNTYPDISLACLGSTTCSQVSDGASTCFGTGGAGYSGSFDTMMTTILNNLPQLSTQRMNCGGKNYAGGFYYTQNNGKSGGIYYYLRGNQTCPPSIGSLQQSSRSQQDDTTLCIALFPTL